jgi:hypothetical protein
MRARTGDRGHSMNKTTPAGGSSLWSISFVYTVFTPCDRCPAKIESTSMYRSPYTHTLDLMLHRPSLRLLACRDAWCTLDGSASLNRDFIIFRKIYDGTMMTWRLPALTTTSYIWLFFPGPFRLIVTLYSYPILFFSWDEDDKVWSYTVALILRGLRLGMQVFDPMGSCGWNL